MSRSEPLPEALGRVFTTRQALDAGVAPSRLRVLDTPTRGTRALTPPQNLREHLDAFVRVLPPECVFSHVTAARLLDLWLPHPWHPSEAVHVSHPHSTPRPRRTGVVSHGIRGSRELTRVGALRVTSAAETWADLCTELTLDQAVVLGDSTVRAWAPRCSPEDLDRALERLRRGARLARAARALVRPGSASAMETLTRLLAVRAGLPEPELNARVVEAGTFIGAFDLVWREQRVIVEYDGDHHRTDRAQWQKDHRRLRAARAAGWTVIVLTADDVLRTPEATARMLRQAMGGC